MTRVKNAFTEQGSLSGALENVAENALDSALGSISPLNNFGRYLTGSRAIIKINNKLFGFAFGVTFNIRTMHEENNTVDDWTPYELMPTRIAVDGTLSMFHVPGKGPSRELVQPNALSFLFHRYITIEIEDQMTGQKIFETKKAVITSRSQSLVAGQLSSMTLQWKSIGWIDEITPFYPTGYLGDDSASGTGGGLIDALQDPSSAVKGLFG